MTLRRCLPLLLLLASAASVRAEDEPPAGRPVEAEEVLLAAIAGDPAGGATRLAREAAAALAAEDLERAYDRLMTLADEHGAVLLPVNLLGERLRGRGDGALRWPVRPTVNRALARLPAALRARAEEAWGPRVDALWTRAQRGDGSALGILAREYGVTARGSAALLMVAERDLEAGRSVRAARQFETWLELNPQAGQARRAAIALRLADVLAGLEDAGGLEAVGLIHHDLRTVAVATASGARTLADRVAASRRRKHGPRPREDDLPELTALEEPIVLWSRSLRDPNLLRQGADDRASVVQAGVWGQGETLVVHEGRRVRRLDTSTGLERWRFPSARLATMHDLTERYESYDLPWRSVTPAGDAVLVVLGDPAASGRYTFLGTEYDADDLGQECRLRLACLDVETGALRWHTGAVDDEHPVLGRIGTGCCAPPLVVGDDVYCVFAQRAGATTYHLARLDLATGRPHWVVQLVAGESGRDYDQSQAGRFTNAYAQSVPWGARPTLADGEICVVPHAGFAAGVSDAGVVRWVRALPRYALDDTVHASDGHSARNVPLAWGDAWIVAAMDSPRMLCLARGSGDLRWQRGGRTPVDTPRWRDVHGIQPDAEGRPRLRASGAWTLTIDPANGAVDIPPAILHWDTEAADPGGRTLDTGTAVLRMAAGSLQARRWQQTGVEARDAAAVVVEDPDVPLAGDLLRVGPVWLVIGTERIAALAAPGDVLGDTAVRLAPDGRPAPDADAARQAAELALRAVLDGAPRHMAAAIEAARTVADAALRSRVFVHIVANMQRLALQAYDTDEEPAHLRPLALLARTLPVPHQGPILHLLTRRLLKRDADEDAARLLLHWLATADDTLVPCDRHLDPRRDDRMRGDLLAAGTLRRYATRPAVARALAEHERASAARIAACVDGDEATLRAALRRAAGTEAQRAGRRALYTRLRAAGRHTEAAAVAADLRLDPPWAERADPESERLQRAAGLQMAESWDLAEAGADLRARTLAEDLRRWGPGGLKGAGGRTQSTLREALRERFGWFPYRPDSPAEALRFDVWRGVSPAKDRDELRSVEFLPLTGPGADLLQEYVVLVRGLGAEVWSLAERRRIASLHGPDEGWFGGSLTSVDRWVPGGGILVSSIVAGEPADRSGVIDGDWVHSWEGQPVRDLATFMQRVASSRPGRTIPVGVWRRGRRILARFTAGRRPPGQGRLMQYGPLWADRSGRVLMPGRTGLTWVDPRARTRTEHWTWREPGVLRRYRAAGGVAYVTIQRGLLPDLVVAVDIASGTERWRVELTGSVTWFAPVGSALWIQTVSPGQALVVDRADGCPRAWYRTFDRHRFEFRKCWEPDREVALACGRAFVVDGDDRNHRLRIVNTTNGAIDHQDAWAHGRNASFGRYANPQVAAGAFAMVLRGGGARLYFPDPLGGLPRHVLDVGRNALLVNDPHHGPLDSDTRILVRGSTIYIVRLPQQGRKNVNVHVHRVDHERVAERDPTDTGPAGEAYFMRTNRAWFSGSAYPSRYVLSIRAGFEGVFVSSARLTGDHQAESWFIAADDPEGDADSRDVRLHWGGMAEARRAAPVRIGPRVFVPTDTGAVVFPARRYRSR